MSVFKFGFMQPALPDPLRLSTICGWDVAITEEFGRCTD